MRTRITVAFAALIAAATLVALPGPVGSRTPSPTGTFDDLAFAPLAPQALDPAMGGASGLDAAWRSDDGLEADSVLTEPGSVTYPAARPRVNQPAAPTSSAHAIADSAFSTTKRSDDIDDAPSSIGPAMRVP